MTRSRARQLGALLLVLGCHDSTSPKAGFRVEARALTPVLTPGATAQIRVTAVNATPHAVTVTSPSTCIFGLEPESPPQEWFYYVLGCGDALTDVTIAPYRSLSWDLSWKTQTWVDGDPVALPPGTYRLRAFMDQYQKPELLSNPVSIVLR